MQTLPPSQLVILEVLAEGGSLTAHGEYAMLLSPGMCGSVRCSEVARCVERGLIRARDGDGVPGGSASYELTPLGLKAFEEHRATVKR